MTRAAPVSNNDRFRTSTLKTLNASEYATRNPLPSKTCQIHSFSVFAESSPTPFLPRYIV